MTSFTTRFIRSGALLALLTFTTTSAIWGQATTALRGVVTDTQGGAVDSANVTLQNDQTGFKRSVVTDNTGVPISFCRSRPGLRGGGGKTGILGFHATGSATAGEYARHVERGYATRLGCNLGQRRSGSRHTEHCGCRHRQRL